MGLFLLASLKLVPEVGSGGPLPDQRPGLPEDIGHLCFPSGAVISQAPWGKGLEAWGLGLQEVPHGS